MTPGPLNDALLLRALATGRDARARVEAVDRGSDLLRVAPDALSGRPDSRAAVLGDRAARLLDRLTPSHPWLAKARASSRWPARLAWGLLAAAFVAGLLSTVALTERRMSLLSFPLLGVLAWNLAVYALLAATALRGGPGGSRASPGWALSLLGWLRTRAVSRGLDAGALETLGRWRLARLPIDQARVAALLHGAAALFAAGAVAGLHVRGLALEFRAGWESTFLDAGAVSALLHAVLGPASALLGLPLPDAAGVEALRWAPGQSGESAGPWIARYSVTVAGAVCLPRVLLAAAAAWRARRAEQRAWAGLAADLFRVGARSGAGARVDVIPYGFSPTLATRERVELLLRESGASGGGDWHEPVPYGSEDATALDKTGSGPRRLVLFNLAATPEPETHGQFAQAVAARHRGRDVALVECAGYRERVGGALHRVAERQQAWRAVLGQAGMPVVMLDQDVSAVAGMLDDLWAVGEGHV